MHKVTCFCFRVDISHREFTMTVFDYLYKLLCTGHTLARSCQRAQNCKKALQKLSDGQSLHNVLRTTGIPKSTLRLYNMKKKIMKNVDCFIILTLSKIASPFLNVRQKWTLRIQKKKIFGF